MLGIGMQEILIILVVALVVIGPKRLPELARTLGKGLAEFKKASSDLQQSIRIDMEKESREARNGQFPQVPDQKPGDEDSEAPGHGTAAAREQEGPGTQGEREKTSGKAGEEEPHSYNPDEIEGGDNSNENG